MRDTTTDIQPTGPEYVRRLDLSRVGLMLAAGGLLGASLLNAIGGFSSHVSGDAAQAVNTSTAIASRAVYAAELAMRTSQSSSPSVVRDAKASIDTAKRDRRAAPGAPAKTSGGSSTGSSTANGAPTGTTQAKGSSSGGSNSGGTAQPGGSSSTATGGTTTTGNAPQSSNPYVDIAWHAAVQAGIDPNLFIRQINQESGFNPNAYSPAGAEGIAQFMPSTAAAMGVNPWDPTSALYGAAKMMGQLNREFGGSYAQALAAYNAGAGTVQYAINAGGGNWYAYLPAETQRYVAVIMGW